MTLREEIEEIINCQSTISESLGGGIGNPDETIDAIMVAFLKHLPEKKEKWHYGNKTVEFDRDLIVEGWNSYRNEIEKEMEIEQLTH